MYDFSDARFGFGKEGWDMLTATSSFVQAIEDWVHAIESDKFAEAKMLASFVKGRGELLVLRPEFRKCFGRHRPEQTPEDALAAIGQFMSCTTECREQASKSRN